MGREPGDMMENHFDFLRQAKPASLYRLLERLPLADAALALAGLPASLSVQVMAFFPETVQAKLMPAMREARQAPSAEAAAVAGRLREILVDMKKSREEAPATGQPTVSPSPSSPPPMRPRGNPYQVQAPAKPAAVPPPTSPSRPAGSDKPHPWVPRQATASPINGPALPGKPQSASGDPFTSPLARAGLLDIIGRAQEKLLPRRQRPAEPARPSNAPAKGKLPRPQPREGVASLKSIGMSKTPRVIGPAQSRQAVSGAEKPAAQPRRMDGKAILAAILREAGGTVRSNLRREDPGLFRELTNRMFYFDDLNLSDDNALARIFTAAPIAEASLALRFAAPALRDRVMRAVSPGRADALRDSHVGRAGLDDIEEAQKKVLAVALQLQAAGRILIDPRDPDLAGGR